MKKIGNYYVLKDGRVWSCNRKRGMKGYKHNQPHRHKKLTLCIGGIFWKIDIHRIVYETFNLKPPSGYEIDHINNDPQDNRLANLQVLSQRENVLKYHKGKEQKNERTSN